MVGKLFYFLVPDGLQRDPIYEKRKFPAHIMEKCFVVLHRLECRPNRIKKEEIFGIYKGKILQSPRT